MATSQAVKKRLIIAGLGDTGTLSAIHLGMPIKDLEVIGINSKPELVSGQELGTRLSDPQRWRKNYLLKYPQFNKLKHLKIIHAHISDLDPTNKTLTLQVLNGETQTLEYDILLIASGVSNGFWRHNQLQTAQEISQDIDNKAAIMAAATTIAVVGGGAAGVSAASNLAEQNPQKSVHLFYSRNHVLPGYHPKVCTQIEAKLIADGVVLHHKHRALITDVYAGEQLQGGTIEWQSGQTAFTADAILWAVGQLKPNNQFIPPSLLNAEGYVQVDAYFRVPGVADVFCIGDIAASDPNRCSARNAGFLVVANNIAKVLKANAIGQTPDCYDPQTLALKPFKPPAYRWGSILGVQAEGLRIYTPKGSSIRIPRSITEAILFPWIVAKFIYKGIRPLS